MLSIDLGILQDEKHAAHVTVLRPDVGNRAKLEKNHGENLYILKASFPCKDIFDFLNYNENVLCAWICFMKYKNNVLVGVIISL